MALINCVFFVGLTLLMGGLVPGIDNAAHIGGLATGVVVGILIFLFSWGEEYSPKLAPKIKRSPRAKHRPDDEPASSAGN